MEKQDKLKAEHEQFYRRIKSLYDPIAIVYITFLRYLSYTFFEFDAVAYAFIFPCCSLKVNNFWLTVACINLSQSLLNSYLYGVNNLYLEAGFTVLCRLCNDFLFYNKKLGDEAIMVQIVGSICLYLACLYTYREQGHVYEPVQSDSYINIALTEFFSTLAIIFATGPIRVFLEVKGGETSVNQIKTELQDKISRDNQRAFGMKQQTVLPDNDSGVRRRNTATVTEVE